jgi:hypothetical protein
MPWVNHTFGQRFVGGSEIVVPITHSLREEARDPGVPLDLTGNSISAEVWWEGCHKLSPAVVIGDLAAGEPHYTVTLNEQQTLSVPLGRIAWVKLSRVDPNGITTVHAPLMLERVA